MTSWIKCIVTFGLFTWISFGCSYPSHTLVPGYIEGEYTYISGAASGDLDELYVKRGQLVKQGELLYKLDPEPEKSNIEKLEANIADLKAQVAFRKSQLERQSELYKKQFASKEFLENVQTELMSKTQQLAANYAELAQGKWILQQKTIYAPVAGSVFDIFFRVGERVQENHSVLAILAPKNIKVLFYIPESELSLIKLGQFIHFNCDNCQKNTKAKIIFISPEAEYTPPVIYSKDTRYKLVFLVRAEMPDEIASLYHPGQPITVDLSP